MNGRILLYGLVAQMLLAPLSAFADFSVPPPAAGLLCRQAIRAAERAHGIPRHLLAAIARVESGRRDQASGTFAPWPWTINADGQGSFYDNRAQAVAAATALRPRVTRSIDVGCMQISLTQHPDAFTSLEQAFDPASNADYGARFLVQLYDKTNAWPKAVELYHSATPELGAEYGRKVYAALPEEQKFAALDPEAPAGSPWAPGGLLNRSLLTAPLRSAGPRVLPMVTAPDGTTAPGRTLAFYRAAPVRLASGAH